jgi:hypothetical protein
VDCPLEAGAGVVAGSVAGIVVGAGAVTTEEPDGLAPGEAACTCFPGRALAAKAERIPPPRSAPASMSREIRRIRLSPTSRASREGIRQVLGLGA